MSDDLLELWSRVVEEYTRCSLTRPSDKLVAISGLAQLFQEETGDQYLAGMWKSRFLECLNWQKSPDSCWTVQGSAVMPGRARRYDEYISPSFSWASFDGPIMQCIHADTGALQFMATATVIEAHCFPSTDNLLGPVHGGYVVVTGPVFQAFQDIKRDELFLMVQGKQVKADIMLDVNDHELIPGYPIDCLVLGQWIASDTQKVVHIDGLLLIPTKITQGSHTRCGHFEIEYAELCKSIQGEAGDLVDRLGLAEGIRTFRII